MMTANGDVWEWCSDWYRNGYYEELVKQEEVVTNPKVLGGILEK